MTPCGQTTPGPELIPDTPDIARGLRRLAGKTALRDAVYGIPALNRFLAPATHRFIAGRERLEAIRTAKQFGEDGIASSIEFMGEDVKDQKEVDRAVSEYLDLLVEVAHTDIRASVSINLSHIGLALNADLATDNLRTILAQSRASATEVILNMEGDQYRRQILKTYFALGPEFDNLGITLQACLNSSSRNLRKTMQLPGRIRLVKGAYDELGEAHGDLRSKRIDGSFRNLMAPLIESGHRCAIATHDRSLIETALQGAPRNMAKESLEVEMLNGVADNHARRLASQGVPVRMYVPYGYDWYVYLLHRMAEYPPNVVQACVEVLRSAGRDGI